MNWDRVTVADCWWWDGPVDRKGYGKISQGKGASPAFVHRLVWEELVGPVPEGLQLDHLCRNHRCCNPDHLEPVTCRENLLRGQTLAAKNAAKTHCPQNHEYDLIEVVNGQARRKCRTCKAAKDRRRRASLRAA